MSSAIDRRLFLAGLMTTAAARALAGAPEHSPIPPLRPSAGAPVAAGDVAALIAAARLGGAVAFAVADARSGRLLETREGDHAMPPASVAKTLTTLFALDRLGPGSRFSTRAIAAGPVSGGVLEGDLILAGGGDPTLDTDGLAELARRIRAAGLRRVTGAIRPWAGALPYAHEIDPGQPPFLGYNPSVSGLILNYNRVYFEWTRQGADYAVVMDARSNRYRPPVSMARMIVADRAAPTYTYDEAGGAERWTVARPALGKGGGRWLPVRHPGAYACEVFAAFLGAEGVAGTTGAPVAGQPSGTVLGAIESAPLAEILRDMLENSTNVVAEALGLAASGGASLAASAAAMSDWVAQRFGATGVHMVDHSGLGPASRVAPADLVKVLADPGSRDRLKPLLKKIHMKDAKGRPVYDHPLHVVAKTGTLAFVSSLAGYAEMNGRELVFAILTGDLTRRSGLSEDERDLPPGARSWNARSKKLQQQLLERWAALYA